jgi:hypothetical protein
MGWHVHAYSIFIISEVIDPKREYKPSTILKNTNTARSLCFVTLKRPVAKAAPANAARIIVSTTARTRLDAAPRTSKPVKSSARTKNNTEAINSPTDHLPGDVFGRILIRITEF